MTATVCSMWAPREPSLALDGPAVLVDEDLVGAVQEPRLDRDDQPGLQRVAAPGATVVGDVRVAVHRPPDAVPAELEVDLQSVGAGHRADGVGDVADLVADDGLGDAGLQRPGGRVDEAQVLLARRADDEADGRVRHPAVDARGEVEGEQVAVGEHVVVGEPVQDGVVDRRAQDVAERRGAEGRVVVDVAGLRAPLADHPVREGVEVEQVDADVGGRDERLQHLVRRTGPRVASARSGRGCAARSRGQP